MVFQKSDVESPNDQKEELAKHMEASNVFKTIRADGDYISSGGFSLRKPENG